ncbi:MAG TPA: FAD-dependent oxidoreductase [Castellaniella sp.]|nr:FAD-dependent oxidoreductase [Castellaniella sp.]
MTRMPPDPYRGISLWFDTLPGDVRPREPLRGARDVDVAILGAGYTGLWTAYYLRRLDPSLSVVVVEAQTAGFGASGRNGGWLKGSLTGDDRYLATLPEDQRRAGHALLHGIVDHVAQVLAEEGIDCGLHKGGVLFAAARYPEQLALLQATLARVRRAGHTEEDYRWLDAAELEARVRMRRPLGALYSPHCAVIDPVRLVRGLAEAVERRGARIFERSPVRALDGRRIRTPEGELRARIVVPALEGSLGSLPGLSGYHLPVQSLIVATEPLTNAQWDAIGLEDRPAFSDAGRFITYGQRSADGRLVFGARGGYRFGARPRHDFDPAGLEFELRKQLMTDLFPALQGVRVTHAWGGTMGMSRRFAPHVVYDAARGLALAGGYGGGGVGASNLFGRTLADLILGRDTLAARMPWVGRAGVSGLRRWEPEPVPWLVYQAVQAAYGWEESLCRAPGAPAWRKQLASRVASTLARLIS